MDPTRRRQSKIFPETKHEPLPGPSISISLTSPGSSRVINHDSEIQKILRKMLEEKCETDWELVSVDGTEFPCHKAVLAAQVPLFADLFAQSKARILVDDPLNALEKIDMDLESDALCGFLQYLYLRDCSEMKKNPKVAIALIRSAHFWEIPNLMNAALQTLAEIRDQNVSRFKPIMNDLVDLQTHVSAWAKEDVMRATVNDIIISIVLQVFNIPEWRVSQLDGVHISSAPS